MTGKNTDAALANVNIYWSLKRMNLQSISKAYDEGRYLFRSFSKAPTQTTASGIWFDLSLSPGNPVAQYYIGSAAGAFTPLRRSTDIGFDHGANKDAPFKKYLHSFEIQSTSTFAAPSTIELMDYLGFYSFLAMDVGVLELTNAQPVPRYAASAGVRMMVVEQNPYVGGAEFRITYTNQDGVADRVTPTIRCNTQISAGTIVSSTPVGINARGLLIPLQSGDYGVESVQSIEFLTGDVGLLCIVLVMPLQTLQIFETTAPCIYDLQRDFGYMPEIKNDAYINACIMPVGNLAGTLISGNMITIWSE